MWQTDHPQELIEEALARVVRNRVEAAYARSDLFAPACLMDDWARYLAEGLGQDGSTISASGRGRHGVQRRPHHFRFRCPCSDTNGPFPHVWPQGP